MTSPTIESLPRLAELYRGKRILLTGSTGFVGKVVLSALLAKYPEVGKIVCVVRAPNDQAADDRFLKDVVASPALDPVRAQHGGLGLREFVKTKCEVRAGDVGRERFGLDEARFNELAKDLDLVVHCAGLVDFVPPLDKGLQANVDGTLQVLDLAKRAGKGRCAFLHVSTCFVVGNYGGQIAEDLVPNRVPHSRESGFDAFDVKREIEEARKLIQRIQTEEVEDPQTQASLWKDAEGSPRKAKRLAEVRAKRRLVEEGLARAKAWGWANTYCYTKALAERLVDAARPELGPVAIVRPAVVESAIRFPVPGWNQGVNTCAPLMWMASRGVRYWPITQTHVLDVIPVDLVVNNMVAVGAALLAKKAKRVYQLGTSATNPLALRRVPELTALAYRKAELPESIWKKFLRKHTSSIAVDPEHYFRFGLPRLAGMAKTARGWLERIPVPRSNKLLKTSIEEAQRIAKTAEREFERGSMVVELFLPFTSGPDFAFRTDNALRLHASLAPEDQAAVPYDPEKIDWHHYFLKVFIPGLERWTFPELKEREGSAADAAPLHQSLVALLEDSAGRFAKKIALRRVTDEGQPEDKLTYDELLGRVEVTAARLHQVGVKRDDRVTLVAENRPAWVAAYFGILRAGATCVPVDSATDAARLLPILKASRSRAVIASKSELARELSERLAGTGVSVLALDAVTAAPDPKHPLKPPAFDPSALAPASLIYTSGTTGAPKGVLLSHAAFAHQVHALSGIYPLGPEDRALSVLPLHHAFEFTAGLLLPLARGATINYVKEPTSDAIKAGLAKIKPTCMIGVPALFEAWHRQIRRVVKGRGGASEQAFDALISVHRGFRKRTGLNLGSRLFGEIHQQFGGELRYAVSGGAALARDVTITFHGIGIDVYEGYGLTEAGPVVCANRPQAGPRPGYVGEPITGVEVKISEPDGEGVGEILVKSPSVMDGYARGGDDATPGIDPKTTAQAIQEGWLRTGDLGRFDDKGRVAIVGRSKDVIVDGAGNTVYPDEIEELFQGCPDVAELAVAGVRLRDEKETVGALVLVKETGPAGATEARERIRNWFRDVGAGLPNAKRVKVLRFTTRALPRTATRKVKRDEVGRILADLARSEPTTTQAAKRSAVVMRGIVGRTLEEVAGVDAESIAPESDLAQDLGLDSIAQADVISSLAESTGRAAPQDLSQVHSVADLVRIFEDQDPTGPSAVAPIEAETRPLVFPKVIRELGSEAVDAFVRLSFARGFKTEVRGLGNIPRHSQAIVVANHASHLDAPLVRYALGDWGKGLVAVGARDYFFKDKLTATYFGNFTSIVAFDRKESIRESLGRVVEILEAGHNVLIFPEGTRSVTGRLQSFKAGLGYLVATSRVGVLPVYCTGTYNAAPKGSKLPRARQLGARIGGFMPADVLLSKAGGGGRARRDTFQRISEIARDSIVALRDGAPFDIRSLPDPEPEMSKEERAAARAARLAEASRARALGSP